MLHFSTWKQVAIILTCLLGVLLVVPNFFSKETLAQLAALGAARRSSTSASTCAAARICCCPWRSADVRKDWLNTLRDDARKRLREAKIPFTAARHHQQRRAGAARQARGHRRGAARRCAA